MIRVVTQHVFDDAITFNINGTSVTINFMEGKMIEDELFKLHFYKRTLERTMERTCGNSDSE